MTVVLIVPRASPEMLRLIAHPGARNSVYGAALALVQTSARRACGYLFMSQSALVMAVSTARASARWRAACWCGCRPDWRLRACALRARPRGAPWTARSDDLPRRVRAHAGAGDQLSRMGLACTGFPGTLGFVGQELLVDGAVDVFPVMGFAVVIASALTGLAVLRMYFSLFCGRSEFLAHPSLVSD
jgi:NADH-quinone oxidoreductase subunit M